jgi:hypothetical protein
MEIEAALAELGDKLVTLIREAAQAKHRSERLSPAEKRAWDNLITVGGDQFSTLSYDSIQGIADAILGKVREKVDERAARQRVHDRLISRKTD